MVEAKVDWSASANRQVRLKFDLKSKEKIFAPRIFIDVVEDGNVPARKEAISPLCLEYPEGNVKFDWLLYICKRAIDRYGSEEPVKTNTQQKRIFCVQDKPQVSYQQNYNANADKSDNELINNF